MATGAYNLPTTSYNLLNSQIIYDIKVKQCYVARDLKQEMSTAGSTFLKASYRLSDSKVITFNNKRFRCPEAFKSRYLAMEASDINETTFTSTRSRSGRISKMDLPGSTEGAFECSTQNSEGVLQAA